MKPTVTAREVISFIWHYWRNEPLWFGILCFALVLNVVIDILFPIVSGHLVDVVSTSSFGAAPPAPEDVDAAIRAGLLFVGQSVAFVTVQRLKFRLWMHFAARIMRAIIADSFAHVQRFSANWHESNHAGGTVRKLTRGMWAYDTIADTIFAALVPAVLMLVGVIAVLAWRWPLLGLYAFATSVAYVGATAIISIKYLPTRHREHMDADSNVGSQVADAITCNAVVKSFGAEAREEARLVDLARHWGQKGVRAWMAMENMLLVQNVASVAMQAGILAFVIYEWAEGRATTGDIVFAITTYLLINAYLRDMGYHLQELQQGLAEIEDVVLFRRLPVECAAKVKAPALRLDGGAIRFDDVRFRYPRKDASVYSNLTLEIVAGERVALVGKSGSGKSTFVKLLHRLYELDSGTVLIDGQDIASVDPTSLRQAVSVVPQEPLLFHRSLKDNIAYARPAASDVEIWQAVVHARAADFISALPDGLDTMVGERGVKLSGGERQRVALARAFLADAPILVLDEATASLDVVTEAAVQHALQDLMEGRTTIIIAHRLSTVRKVDRILVFDEGKIVEDGAYDDLITLEGGYLARFHAVQSEDDLSPADEPEEVMADMDD